MFLVDFQGSLSPLKAILIFLMHIIARILTGVLAGNFDHDGLFDLLNAELDILAISPQAKEEILPNLIGIMKVIEVQWQW
jgi:hypothetical protein